MALPANTSCSSSDPQRRSQGGSASSIKKLSTPLPADPKFNHWRKATWPARCLESGRLHRRFYARLFPLVYCGGYPGLPSGRVRTVLGHGQLLSAGPVCTVWLDRDVHYREKRGGGQARTGHTTALPYWQVWPVLAE